MQYNRGHARVPVDDFEVMRWDISWAIVFILRRAVCCSFVAQWSDRRVPHLSTHHVGAIVKPAEQSKRMGHVTSTTHDHPDHKVVKLGPEQLQEAVAQVEQQEQHGETSLDTFNFGKYKGKTVEWVKKEAPSHLFWVYQTRKDTFPKYTWHLLWRATRPGDDCRSDCYWSFGTIDLTVAQISDRNTISALLVYYWHLWFPIVATLRPNLIRCCLCRYVLLMRTGGFVPPTSPSLLTPFPVHRFSLFERVIS